MHKSALIKVLLTFCHYMVTLRLPPFDTEWSVGRSVGNGNFRDWQRDALHRTPKHESNGEEEEEEKKLKFAKLTLLTCAKCIKT